MKVVRPASMHAGDALTLARVIVTPLFVWSFRRALASPHFGLVVATIFVGVVASDYFDGFLARRAGQASQRGRVFDSVADIVFLLASLGGAVEAGLAPWWVPAAIAVSFAFYVTDSWWRTRKATEPALLSSRIGHAAGVCNYALIGILTFNNACGLQVLGPDALHAIYYLVPLYSAAAMASRLRSCGGGARRSAHRKP